MSLSSKNKGHSDLENVSSETQAQSSALQQLSWKDQFKLLRKYKRVVLTGKASALGCSTTPILIGYDLMLVGSIIANKEFVRDFGVFDERLGLIWTVVQYISAIFSALCSGQLNDIPGRRFCFFVTVGLTIAGTISQLFSPDWKVWLVAKLLMGAAMGSMQANTQTYVSEVTPVEIRGFTLSLFQFWIIIGSLVASCVLQGTSYIESSWSWKAAVVTQFGPAALSLIIFIPLVPESPYYLIAKGRLDDARQALIKIRGKQDFNVDTEIQEILSTLEQERQASSSGKSSTYLE
ncbi:high-affinity glucose transporter HXT2 [Colletotrichum liriopes]|uniref:High-affinity glucose transporter HXT2 n=1 Tax=Colletotrichum liriopes TaxID=708192 RepID=A0AA37H1K3_9PEZI|nr:high-affinity glucose transporter HXT2 [Colletotrichum liriopes]